MSDTTFRTVLRGYEPTEVDHYVQSLRDATEAARVAAAERTVELEKTRAQHSQALGETEQLRQRVARLEENSKTAAPPSFAELGERIGKILTLAQEESAQLRAAARSEADRVLEEAQSKSNRVISQAQAQADEAISRTDAEVARRLSDAQRRADEILDIADREAAARREEAEAVYERQRARAAAAATEFETTLAERRDNAAAEFARALAGHDQSLAAAEEKLAAVEKEAETRKADSEREADHLLSGARRGGRAPRARGAGDGREGAPGVRARARCGVPPARGDHRPALQRAADAGDDRRRRRGSDAGRRRRHPTAGAGRAGGGRGPG